ncbi:NCS1 family transporter [Litchfieldia salsa]|uniref:Nucleobase:cation symporter-1, NCS1 family n=1 Tax=Litchfieldia salsa TaxID=930152 RepID=A0A1H0Q181_9BACI|nr:NCS1 family transporter [Litchfieldia salsa]SDP11191.1 nucleobase:cation symporter-1, NCS1 family [Litchfieldia salsa]
MQINSSLLPIMNEKNRILGPKSYVAMWWGDAVMVGSFMLGSSLIPPFGQLNLTQAFLALILANVLAALLFALNGKVGWKHGIPMVVQLRSSFGPIGAKVPSLMRAVPALFWYGVQSWLGAMALNQIFTDIIGFNNVWVWFFAFQAFQIYLSAKGIKSIKWIEIVGAIVIMLGVIYLIFLFLDTFGFEVQETTNIDGSWGIPFWLAMAVLIGQFSALLLNVSDYTRYFPRKSSGKTFIGSHIVGIVPPMILLPFVGILGAAAVGIWNPVDIISRHISNLFASIVILLFIAIAQITTNLVANIMPPVLVAMELFKISWEKACVIVGVLGVFTCPWWIMTDSAFLMFISVVSAFLGPIFAVMVADFYVIHKGNYNVAKLYEVENLFKAFKGWNPAAFIAIGVGTVFSFINVDLSWLLGIIPAAVVYVVVMKVWVVKHERYVSEGMEQSFKNTNHLDLEIQEDVLQKTNTL